MVVRIRGTIKASKPVRETLQMLNLARTNNLVVINNSPSFLGMLKKVQNFVTWGEASKETVKTMIKERGSLSGNKKLTDGYAQKIGYESLDELAEAIFDCSVEYWKLPDVNPNFRLHPPTKGYKGKVKKGYAMGGELGYRGKEINELVKRMI